MRNMFRVYNAFNGQKKTDGSEMGKSEEVEENSAKIIMRQLLSANSILSLKTGRFRVVIQISKKSTMN